MLAGATQFPGRDDLWLDDGTVVRRHDTAAASTIGWIHHVLAHLDFNAPKPVPYFDGRSVATRDGVVWSAVSYVEGEIVGWSARPSMFELGGHLARFHDAVASVTVHEQQSPAFPVDQLPGLGGLLQEIGHAQRPRQVVHGDFTNHNVVAVDGRACGVIDFANAYVDVPLVDIGFALWRSGRPRQDTDEFDRQRIHAYVDGYSSERPLTDDDRVAVLVYLRARGVQIVTKQRARGAAPDDGPLRKLAWLERHWRSLR